jgi:hypothetical protein
VSFSSLNENETDMQFTESDNLNTMINTKLQKTKENLASIDNNGLSNNDLEFNHENDQIDDK